MSFQTGDGNIYARLAALHPKRIDLSLGRLERLLEKLGSPEKQLPRVIHVAGTNGKGSTIAFCRAFLESAGRQVHVYTSPHLVRFNERIRTAGELVSDAVLNEALEHCEKTNAGDEITFFEITTAAAFWLFSKTAADYTLIEVGLGGRFDATNVIDKTTLSIITPVSLDHQEYLGESLQQIAAEKAGILKENVPCVLGEQDDEAKTEIEKIARQLRAPLFKQGEQWSINEEHGRLVYQDEQGLLDLPPPRLAGRHQYDNAGCAIAAMRVLDPNFPITALEQGLRAVEWPARLQRLDRGPLVARAPREAEIWLDGGHNPAGARVLAETMAELEEKSPRPLFLVTGMLETKPADIFFRHFSGLAAKVLTVTITSCETSYNAQDLALIASQENIDATAMPDIATALSACAALDPEPRILICGSLYLAGEVLKLNGVTIR